MITIDTVTGQGTEIGTPSSFFTLAGLTFNFDTDTLVTIDYPENRVVDMDTSTGAATIMGALGFLAVPGMTFDPSSQTLYATCQPTAELLIIDRTTGSATAVGSLGFTNVRGLAFDIVRNTLFGTDLITDQLISIDTATGAGTAVGSTQYFNVEGLAMLCLGDLTGDCVVLLADFDIFLSCFTGPEGGEVPFECAPADLDSDDDIDFADFGRLQRHFDLP